MPSLLSIDAFEVIGDPLFELNFKNSSIWHTHIWTYSTTFEASHSAASSETLLVFDGIKMGANITLNGKLLGTATDQFLRYAFPLQATGSLRAGSNTISVAFDPSIQTNGRFMACTGGWDWAPCMFSIPIHPI